MKKITLVCGLISGFILCVFMVSFTILCYANQDYETGMVYGYASMILSFSLIFVGVKNYRDKYNNGTISFGKAFKIGFYITLIASTMYVAAWLIEYYLFIPDFMDKYSDHMLKTLQTNNLSKVQLDKQVQEIVTMKEMYRNPLFVIMFTFAEVLPVGLLVTLICAFILKKKTDNTVLALPA